MSEETSPQKEKKSLIPDWNELLDFLHDKGAPIVPKVLLVVALLYLLWPLDLIPDLVPILGWLDDLGVSIIALSYLGYAMDQYFGKLPSEAAKKHLPKRKTIRKKRTPAKKKASAAKKEE